eukprot:TRINITY_DN3883_c0_g1_i5.p1 TRINITY_DN3883_c0_g1~~TRINITY_DN3883_c0_g1_i5.p1  ORF type:complete len:231 (-),score=57.45 TRINITY_DN3883_c0_g1_i5:48-740(-)
MLLRRCIPSLPFRVAARRLTVSSTSELLKEKPDIGEQTLQWIIFFAGVTHASKIHLVEGRAEELDDIEALCGSSPEVDTKYVTSVAKRTVRKESNNPNFVLGNTEYTLDQMQDLLWETAQDKVLYVTPFVSSYDTYVLKFSDSPQVVLLDVNLQPYSGAGVWAELPETGFEVMFHSSTVNFLPENEGEEDVEVITAPRDMPAVEKKLEELRKKVEEEKRQMEFKDLNVKE